jgi:hypothetical protein
VSAEKVLKLIRERVRTGQLPSGPADKTYGSKGSNTACACCGRKIASHEIEYEVHFNSSPRALSTHFYCYQIWWGEWRAYGAHEESETRSVAESE